MCTHMHTQCFSFALCLPKEESTEEETNQNQELSEKTAETEEKKT